MSSSASASGSQVPTAAGNIQTPAAGKESRVPAAAGSSHETATAPASAIRVPSLSISPPPLAVIRYVCTINIKCGKCFSNYNDWAQHETVGHVWVDRQHEDDARARRNEANLSKRAKSQKAASAKEQPESLKKSNAQQTANAIKKADALASTFDFWYCDGMDGCIDGWYKQEEFEAHFMEMHTMGWNKLPRSTLHTDYLLGPEHGVRLWCGFCNMVCEVSSKDNWYADRIAHIASHFDFTCPDEIWYCNIFGWYFIEMH